MDGHEARYKRLRTSAPSHSAWHQSIEGNDHEHRSGYGDGSASTSELPALNSLNHLAPLPGMAARYPAHPDARKDSHSAKLNFPTTKRKATDVIDLTEDLDSPAPMSKCSGSREFVDLTEDSNSTSPLLRPSGSYDDVAKQPQAQYHTTNKQPQQYQLPNYPQLQQSLYPQQYQYQQQCQYPQQNSNPPYYPYLPQYPVPQQFPYTQHPFPQQYSYPNVCLAQEPGVAGPSHTIRHIHRDERSAQKLTAQPFAKQKASVYSPGFRNIHDRNDIRESMGNGVDYNEACARHLQNEHGFESSTGTTQSPGVSIGARGQATGSTLGPHATRDRLQRWTETARRTACAGCNSLILPNEMSLQMRFKRWFEDVGHSEMNITSVLGCEKRSCSTATCLGCGKLCRTMASTGQSHSVKIDGGATLSWCCDSGRMVLLWVLLCGCDRRGTVQRRRGAYFKKPSKASNTSGTGVGYGDSYPTEYDFEPHAFHVNADQYGTNSPHGYPAARRAGVASMPQNAEDEFTARLMNCLDVLLPSLSTGSVSEFDTEPPAVLAAVLTQSNILSTIAALLRNDSIEDATKRLRLYNSTLNVVNKLSSHDATASLTVHQMRGVSKVPSDILSISFTSAGGIDNTEFEDTPALASCLHGLVKQSKTILARAAAHPEAFVGGDSELMLSLCKRVSDTADFLAANATTTPEQRNLPTPPSNDDWQSDLTVMELDDTVILPRHSYAAQASSASNLAVGRMKSLSLQLTSLTTGVPPGVFVRYCSSRLDIMKILIIGPKGTPYENGLFEFDLFCPATFPNSPPQMSFRTTGGGKVRFNPNLYQDGTVCLSLLGTWTGPSWEPGKSTILQILVSIQAMIFCDEPWYNEPGRRANPNASLEHNRQLQGHTVQHGILDWLKPDKRSEDSVWGDVVRGHFKANARAIEQTLGAWGSDRKLRNAIVEEMRKMR